MAKNHTFVSFTDRVAAIRIDPVRRSEKKRLTQDLEDTSSFIVSALDRWKELNLASDFTAFSHQCFGMAQSLPVVLYNQKKIIDNLLSAIEGSNEHSMEPLLDLLVNLARDLGEDFEPYYPHAVNACIGVIQRNQNDDALLGTVELAFNCLASIFKFLSRLLTSNLVPTFEILMPLFGGTHDVKQRHFVLRFAAESMAFLVRRSQGDNLYAIVEHIISKAVTDASNEQYMHSVTQLLATTLKGPGNSLHSKAPTLLTTYYDMAHKYYATDLISHVLVEVLHHARKETAEIIYTVSLAKLLEYNDKFAARCLFIITGLRKGDRVHDANAIFDALLNLSCAVADSLEWLQAATAAISFLEVVAVHRHVRAVFTACSSSTTQAKLIELISMDNAAVLEAFGSTICQELIDNTDARSETDLKRLALVSYDVKPAHVYIVTNDKVTGVAESVRLSDKDGATSLFKLWCALLVEKIRDPKRGAKLLDQILRLDFSFSTILSAFQANVVAYIVNQTSSAVGQEQLSKICQLPFTPTLLHSLVSILKTVSICHDSFVQTVSSKVYLSLMSCDKRNRAGALELLKCLIPNKNEDPQSLLDQCSVINGLPLDLANARNVSHRMRQLTSKLAIACKSGCETEKHLWNDVVIHATVSFVFGMLTARLQPVSMAVLSVMPKIGEVMPELLCNTAMKFIEHPEQHIIASTFMIDHDSSMGVDANDYYGYQHPDCNTLDEVQSQSENVWTEFESITESLEKRARLSLTFEHYDDLRSLGIKALCKVPQIAERQVVRTLVPYLLSAEDEDDQVPSNEQELQGKSFDFKDKIALLELFAKLRTPQNLPHFDQVLEKYLSFLGSRHTPLQKLGLKCLLATNTPSTKDLRKYRENFDAMLDDKRFRDEITSFICTSDHHKSEGSLHNDDKPTIMPFVIRVLYGRAQNSSKRNMRHAVMSSLLFVEPQYLDTFVDLSLSHLRQVDKDVNTESGIDCVTSRKFQGYLTLMTDFIHHMKGASERCIPKIAEQGIFPVLNKLSLQDDKTLRQLVTKVLDEMLTSVPKISVWEPLFPVIYKSLISPQLINYGVRNLENLSTIQKLALSLSTEKDLVGLIDKDIAMALVSGTEHEGIKDVVLMTVLQFVINLTSHVPESDVTRCAIAALVKNLPQHMDGDLSAECFSVAVEAVNKMFALGVNTFDATVVHNLAEVSFKALQKPSKLAPLHVKGSLLLALAQILSSSSCTIELIDKAYEILAPLFRQFVLRDSRIHLSNCYKVFGDRKEEYSRVGVLVAELNSFDNSRLGEPDFARRSVAFEELNENLWTELSEKEWKPIVFNLIYFIRDPEELALRNYGKYSLLRLIESQNAPNIVNEYVVPAIKRGLRDAENKFMRTYIDLLGQCARYNVLPTLNLLLFNGDEEADFFVNIAHVQVHRRRRAIQRLVKLAPELDQSVIAHYLLSIIESFTSHSGSKNDDMNNLADDALHAVTELLKCVSEGQFKSVARRYVQNVKMNPEPAKLRKVVRVVTSVSQATPQGIDNFVLNVLVFPLCQVLTEKSNEHENLPDRVPLSVAIVHFMKSLKKETLELQLPGKLSALCQLLRSKIPEMRDTVRQSLSRIIRSLGAKYLHFLVKELSSALNRGGLQCHVLGFTVHSLLVELNRDKGLNIGDTDDSAGLIFKIVMSDTFGSTGEEKDNESYVTVAKEVKQHKSYDTAEIIATWTSLSQFGKIINPLRSFLSSTKLSSKTEHKVEEVLRRLAAGLHKNAQGGTQDAVVMGYEIFALCKKILAANTEVAVTSSNNMNKISGTLAARNQAAKESEDYFTVRLSSRDWYDGSKSGSGTGNRDNASMRYAATNFHLLQTFALDTLRSVLTSTSGGATSDSGKGLLTVSNVKGLMPIIIQGFESTQEDMNIAALRLATVALRLPVQFAEDDDSINVLGKRSLDFIESSPDTNSLLCQTALKFLIMLVSSKPEFELQSGPVGYILERIKPDVEDPERQGTAVSFMRAIFTRKVMLPQVYDSADLLSRILVTNQSDHIRVNCRAAYLKFLSTYPLGQTRLERHLSALGANLHYASPSGRLSVIDMIADLLHKIKIAHLEPVFIQWYASLVLILVSDEEPKCRSKALELLKVMILNCQSTSVRDKMIEYCVSWLKNMGKNEMLVRGGLEVAKQFIDNAVGAGINSGELQRLKTQLDATVSEILSAGQRESGTKIDWQLVYLALNNAKFDMIDQIEEVLLFPHPWVRARATRIFGNYFKSTPQSEIPLTLLIRVGQKLTRQLGAPRLNSVDTLQIVKNLAYIIPIWDSKNATRPTSEENASASTCVEWLLSKLSAMIRTDVSAEEYIGAKIGAIQILASLPSLVNSETLHNVSLEAIRCLYILNDQLTAENILQELSDLATEAMSMYDKALGTTEYLKRYTAAKRFVDDRRRERKSKRSIQAVVDPEFAAQKRMKKNLHKRAVRKTKKHQSHHNRA